MVKEQKNRKQQIGFCQRIRLEWIETTANLVIAGNNQKLIRKILQDLLKDKLSVGSDARRNSRDKTISILMKIWVSPPKYLKGFYHEGIKLLKKLPSDEHLALHWGMTLAVYPFWGDVALQTGRLLKLQGHVSVASVIQRLKEEYGERETVLRAVRKVLRTFIDWKVLEKTEKKGIYTSSSILNISNPELIGWLIEAYLYSQTNGSRELKSIIQSPIFFPFSFKNIQAVLKLPLSRIEAVNYFRDQQLIYLKQMET